MVRIGQKLRETRIKKGLSLEDVASATKIKASFLSAIERGEYHKLPSSAYAQGFVSNYASYLGLPKRESLALFRREFSEERELRVLPEGFTKSDALSAKRIRVHQTLFIVAAFFLVFFAYLLFQYRYAFINPPLEITSPKDGSVVSGSDITVSGKTDPNATVLVNNDAVVVGNKGEFMKKITAFSGKTIIIITAKNRLNRETTVERKVEVK